MGRINLKVRTAGQYFYGNQTDTQSRLVITDILQETCNAIANGKKMACSQQCHLLPHLISVEWQTFCEKKTY